MGRKKVVQFSQDLPSTWEDAMQQYLWFKQAEGLREVTIEGHRTVRHPEDWGQPNPKIIVICLYGGKH